MAKDKYFVNPNTRFLSYLAVAMSMQFENFAMTFESFLTSFDRVLHKNTRSQISNPKNTSSILEGTNPDLKMATKTNKLKS